MVRSFLVVAILLTASTASAEPWFSQMEGYRCSKCHVNGTGGGMRTDFGRQWAWSHLSLISLASTPADDGGDSANRVGRPEPGPGASTRAFTVLNPVINDSIAVGANVRVDNTTTFADEEVQNSFGNPEANFYLALDALQYLTAYVDTSVAEGNVEAREAFVMLHRIAGFRLKGGVILLPYGLRIWGEEQFIRRETGFTYANSDLGVELGYEWKGLGAFFAVSNGSGGGIDSDPDKRFTGTVEWLDRWWRIGLSSSFNSSDSQEEFLVGAHAGLTLGRLALLGQTDVIRSNFTEADQVVEEFVAYAEANLLVLRGLNLKAAFGFHDPTQPVFSADAIDVAEDQRFNVLTGVEVFIVPMLATRMYYEVRESVPQDEVGNADIFAVELHVYL